MVRRSIIPEPLITRVLESKNYPEAVKWLRKAAEQELDMAQYNPGMVYSRGEGVRKNPRKAVSWLKKAAKQNLLIALAGPGYV